jgi:outer membrane protein assembly factor BamB
MLLLAVATARSQDWPQWRGPNRDNHVVGFVEPKTWPKELAKKWSVKVGIGESSPVSAGDKIYTFGRQGNEEVTLCLDAATGKEIWNDKYKAVAVTGPASGYPGARSTPAVGDGKVCTLGVGGVVSCLDAKSGKVIWRKDREKPLFYTSTSPMIVDGKCIIFAGPLTAFDLATGEEKWTWAGAGAPYGSPVLLAVDGVKQVVTPAAGKGKGTSGMLAGVSFADGKLLWQIPIGAPYQSNYSTPVVNGDTVIYSETGGKGKAGGNIIALKIEKKGDGFSTKELWKMSFSAAGYHTPVLKGNLLFGVNSALNFFCMDVKTGATLWTDKTRRGQSGAILDAGSVLLALSSDQDLIAFEPSAKEYKEIAKYHVGEGETWSVPIIAGNRVYVKDKGGSLSMLTIE